jgi:PBSX family phage terminase large subunit
MAKSALVKYRPQGAQVDIFYAKEDEVLVCGPAGTGKSRAVLEKIHLVLLKYPGARALMVRKTRASLTHTGMFTYEKHVLPAGSGISLHSQNQDYRYNNQSSMVVGGMDNSDKIMSAEYDIIYPQEATELTEDDWEKLSTRLRNNKVPYQQILADCNPDAPTHWLKQRCDAGKARLITSTHEDNPVLYDEGLGQWTESGKKYLAKLDALTGVRYLRLRKGIWAAAEGLVYDAFSRDLHVVPRFEPDPEWPRFWSVDFGFTNPFVWQEWVLDPETKTLYLYREIYKSQTLVSEHAAMIADLVTVLPVTIVCDHNPEGQQILQDALGMGMQNAYKNITEGIQKVQERLHKNDAGHVRIKIMQDALQHEPDPVLIDKKVPTCTLQEFDGYVWDTPNPKIITAQKRMEYPVKKNDHGMDAMRYIVSQLDIVGVSAGVFF